MIGIALVAGVIILALVIVGSLQWRFHPENHTAIRPGMTLQQVDDLLGGPPGDYGWFRFGSTMMTQEGVVAPPWQHGDGMVQRRPAN
jgi:hypothetical protein